MSNTTTTTIEQERALANARARRRRAEAENGAQASGPRWGTASELVQDTNGQRYEGGVPVGGRTPPPPPGFVLDGASASAVPPPPPGFVLEGQGGPRFPGRSVQPLTFDDQPQAPRDLPVAPAGRRAPLTFDEPDKRFGGIAMNGTAGLNEGLYAVAGAPVDIVRGAMNLAGRGINAVTGADIPQIPENSFGGSRFIAETMGAVRPELDPRNTVAMTAAERVARGSGQGLSTVVAPAGVVGAMTRGGMLGARGAGAGEAMFGRAGSAVDAGLGAAGGAGAAAGQELAPEGYGTVGALAGGLLGGGAGYAAYRGTAAAVAPFHAGGREAMAGRQLLDGARDEARLRESLVGSPEPLVPGSQPTTFQRTGDLGFGGLEKDAANRFPERFAERRGEQNVARITAMRGVVPDGAPEKVAATVRQRLEAIETETERMIGAATDQARQRAGAMGAPMAPEVAGGAMRNALEEARSAARAQERALWSAVDPDGTLALSASNSKRQAIEIVRGMPASAKPPSGDEAAILATLQQYPDGAIPFHEVAAMKSRLGDALRAERSTNGETQTYRRLSQLRGALQADLDTAIAERVAQETQAVAAGRMSVAETMDARVQAWADNWLRERQAVSSVRGGSDSSVSYGAGGPPSVSRVRGAGGEAGGRLGSAPRDPGLSQDARGAGGQAGAVSGFPSLPSGARIVASDGPLGPSVDGLQGRYHDAVAWLSQARTGDVRGALSHPEVGPIDLVWGHAGTGRSDGAGLAKIIEFHPEVLDDLPQRLAEMRVVSASGNRVRLESDRTSAGVRLEYDGQQKTWLLTAFDPGEGGRHVGRSTVRPDALRQTDASSVSPTTPNVSPNAGGFNAGDGYTRFDQAAMDRLNAANAATRQRVETFDNRTLAPIRQRPGSTSPYTMPAGAVPAQIFNASPRSPEAIARLRSAIGEEAATEALQGYAVGQVLRAAARPDGTLDAVRLNGWRRSHADALRAVPGLDAKLIDAGRASEAIAEVAVARAAASTAAQKGALGRLVGVDAPEDVTRIVGGLFSRQDAVAQFRQLSRAIGNDVEAKKGLRRAVLDHMTARFVGNVEVGTSGVGGMRPDGFQNFVRQNGAALREAGFSTGELRVLDAIAQDLQRSGRSASSVRNPGGSDTAQNLFARVRGQTAFGTVASLLGAPGVAGVGVGVTSGTMTGLAAGAGAGLVMAMRNAGVRSVDDLVADALLNPDRARLLLQKVPAGQEGEWLRKLSRSFAITAMRDASSTPSPIERERERRSPPPSMQPAAMATPAMDPLAAAMMARP